MENLNGIENKKAFLLDLLFPRENYLKEGTKVKINVNKLRKEKKLL